MDALAFHTLIQLIRNGYLDQADCNEIADRLTAEGETDAAHAARAAVLEASMGNPADRERERVKLRLIEGGEQEEP